MCVHGCVCVYVCVRVCVRVSYGFVRVFVCMWVVGMCVYVCGLVCLCADRGEQGLPEQPIGQLQPDPAPWFVLSLKIDSNNQRVGC